MENEPINLIAKPDSKRQLQWSYSEIRRRKRWMIRGDQWLEVVRQKLKNRFGG